MFPCALPSKKSQRTAFFCRIYDHTNHTQFMPDSYPNRAPPHSFPPISHPGCFGGACRKPLLESLVEECDCLVCPAFNRCCLFTASAQGGPPAGIPTNPTIQLQSCEPICESYPRIIPPNHTPNHTFESYHLFKLPGLCFWYQKYVEGSQSPLELLDVLSRFVSHPLVSLFDCTAVVAVVMKTRLDMRRASPCAFGRVQRLHVFKHIDRWNVLQQLPYVIVLKTTSTGK